MGNGDDGGQERQQGGHAGGKHHTQRQTEHNGHNADKTVQVQVYLNGPRCVRDATAYPQCCLTVLLLLMLCHSNCLPLPLRQCQPPPTTHTKRVSHAIAVQFTTHPRTLRCTDTIFDISSGWSLQYSIWRLMVGLRLGGGGVEGVWLFGVGGGGGVVIRGTQGEFLP